MPTHPGKTHRSEASQNEDVAPPWHTALLVSVILSVAAVGWWTARGSGSPNTPPVAGVSRIVGAYLPMIAVQGMLAIYVVRVGRARSALASLVGRVPKEPAAVARDAALAALTALIVIGLETALNSLSGPGRSASVRALLPHTDAEHVVWVAVAVSAGVSEELVYRGYLQRQLRAWSGSVVLAVVLQAALFGVAHGERGRGAVIHAAAHGVVFGALATWRRSLVPGMLAHTAIDVVGGLAG